MPHQVTLIPGDGIGPEVAVAAMRAIDATGAEEGMRPIVFSTLVQDDVREVLMGRECGIRIKDFDDVQVGDRLFAFDLKEVER